MADRLTYELFMLVLETDTLASVRGYTQTYVHSRAHVHLLLYISWSCAYDAFALVMVRTHAHCMYVVDRLLVGMHLACYMFLGA